MIRVLRRGRSDWSSFDQPRIRAAFQLPDGLGIAPTIPGALECEFEPSQEDVKITPRHLVASNRLKRRISWRSSFCTSRSASTSKVASGLPPILIADSDDEDAPGGRESPVSLSPGLQDNFVVTSRKRRRLSKAAVPESSCSCRKPKGWKLVLEGDGPLSVGRGDLISLA